MNLRTRMYVLKEAYNIFKKNAEPAGIVLPLSVVNSTIAHSQLAIEH